MKPTTLYRGFEIFEDEKGFGYRRAGDTFVIRRCNTAWGCVCSIDEDLSP